MHMEELTLHLKCLHEYQQGKKKKKTTQISEKDSYSVGHVSPVMSKN